MVDMREGRTVTFLRIKASSKYLSKREAFGLGMLVER